MADDDQVQNQDQPNQDQLQALLKRLQQSQGPQQQQQQQLDPRVQKVREKAKFDAENFETRYTVKQKARIAQLKQAQSSVDANEALSDKEKEAAHSVIAKELVGINPPDLPRNSQYPKGKGTGETWNENGILMTRNKDGIPTGVPHQNSGPDYLAAKAKYSLQNMQLKYQQQQQQSMRDILKDHVFETTVDSEGNEMRRKRSPLELKEIAQAVNGITPPQQEGIPLRNQQFEPQTTPNWKPGMPWNQADLPKIIPSDYSKKQLQEMSGVRQMTQNRRDAFEDAAFMRRHEGDPHAADKLDEMRQHRSDKRDVMRHQMQTEQIQTKRLEKQQQHEKRMAYQAHHTELMRRRQFYSIEKTPDDKSPGGYKITYLGPHAIDKKMMDEFGETGKDTFDQWENKLYGGKSSQQPTQPQSPGPSTVPMPKNATWIHFSDWEKAKSDWNDDQKVPPGSWVVLPDGSKKHKVNKAQ